MLTANRFRERETCVARRYVMKQQSSRGRRGVHTARTDNEKRRTECLMARRSALGEKDEEKNINNGGEKQVVVPLYSAVSQRGRALSRIFSEGASSLKSQYGFQKRDVPQCEPPSLLPKTTTASLYEQRRLIPVFPGPPPPSYPKGVFSCTMRSPPPSPLVRSLSAPFGSFTSIPFSVVGGRNRKREIPISFLT